MKKTISLFLALVMCLTLCACSASNDAPKSNMNEEPPVVVEEPVAEPAETEAQTVYTMGDTVSNGMFEFTPTFEGFTDEVANWPDQDYMTPNGQISGNNPFKASNEKVIMYFSGNVKYVGNSKSNETFWYDFTVDYDNGYLFEFNENYNCGVKAGDSWNYTNMITFEPLSSAKEGYVRFCIEVPQQLEADPENIVIDFNICGSTFRYRLG